MAVRIIIQAFVFSGVLLIAFGCKPAPTASPPATTASSSAVILTWNMKDKVQKSDEEWARQLSAEQFRVLRKHGTERAFTGAYWNTKDPGIYLCAACGLALFKSDDKFDSGTGWPSFTKPLKEGHVGSMEDNSLFSRRTEVHCARCGGHLGHVFEDGPQPTGLRYCINSASIEFTKASNNSPPPETPKP